MGTGNAGYRSYIVPDHPLIEALFPSDLAREAALEAALEVIGERFHYVTAPGRASLDDLWAAFRATPRPRTVDANCISLCCVLLAYLRSAGYRADEAYVALGGMRRMVQYHAWVFVRRDSDLLWIPPENLEPVSRAGDELRSFYRFFALFNDRSIHFLEQDKERTLAPFAPSRHLHLVLYGKSEPALTAALADPAFRTRLEDLLDAPADRPQGMSTPYHATDHDWVEAGLLTHIRSETTGDSGPVTGHVVGGPRLLLVPASALVSLRERLADPLAVYRATLRAAAERLEATYHQCPVADHVPWHQVAHVLVAGMLMDVAIGERLIAEGDALESDDGSVIWAFEGPDRRPVAHNPFGVQWIADRSERSLFAQLWHRTVPRQPPKMPCTMVGWLGRLAAQGPIEGDGPHWLFLRYLRLVKKVQGKHASAIPAFGPEDVRRLSPILADAADALIARAIRPCFVAAAEDPWWRRGSDNGPTNPVVLRHAILRLVLEWATDDAVADKIFQPFPMIEDANASWGRWVWCEGQGSATNTDAPPSLVPSKLGTPSTAEVGA